MLVYKFYLKNSENALVIKSDKAANNFVHNDIINHRNYKVSIFDERGLELVDKEKIENIF